MRIYSLVMSVTILFAATSAFAQQRNDSAPQRPVVTKGYYAIGNNASKLAPVVRLSTKPVSVTGAEFNKGYYSIGNNRRKLPREAGFIPVSNVRPKVTKGYYSIGNNAEKLRN